MPEGEVTAAEAAARGQIYEHLHYVVTGQLNERVLFAEEFNTSDAEVYERWKEVAPRDDFGFVSGTDAKGTFVKEFKDAVQSGTLDNFLHEQLQKENPYDNIYISRTSPNYQEGALRRVAEKLHGFVSELPDNLLPLYQGTYRAKVQEQLQFITAIGVLGTPEFTTRQKNQEEWGQVIDQEASLKEGKIVLPYEELARDLLTRERPQIPPLSIKQALQAWRLSQAEQENLGNITDDQTELPSEQTKILFEIVLQRFGVADQWHVQIKEDKNAINVVPTAQETVVPASRKLQGDEVIYITAHENGIHVVSSINGSKQDCKILSEGTAGYEATQEGIAVIAEMAMGEPFGHDRQIKMAARYIAVAMALKAEEKDNTVVPTYSMQDIYNVLTQTYGVNEKDAADIVWRTSRGTSLTHQGIFIEVATDQGIKRLPAAECFAKDAIYFQGQMEVFQWIKDTLPFAVGTQHDVVNGSLDFSEQFLTIAGAGAWHATDISSYFSDELDEKGQLKTERPLSIEEIQNSYEALASLGKYALFELLDYLTIAKLPLEDLTYPESPWRQVLKYSKDDEIIKFSDILQN